MIAARVGDALSRPLVRAAIAALTATALSVALAAVVGALVSVAALAGLGNLIVGDADALAREVSRNGSALSAAGAALLLALVSTASARRRALSGALAVSSVALLASAWFNGGLAELVASSRPGILAGCAVAGLMLILGLASVSSAFRGNYDTGAEHGAERMATAREMSELLDGDFFFNNIPYSAHSGQSLHAWNKRLRAGQASRNRNDITIGTSGLGKTYHCVMPDLLNAAGAYPEPLYSGGVRSLVNWLGRRGPRIAPASIAAPGRSRRFAAAAAACPGFGDGYDVVHTDPKGDTLRDIGRFYEMCGIDIKLFDTVDFAGMGYNPLDDAYIQPHETDVKEAALLASSLSIAAAPAGGGAASRASLDVRPVEGAADTAPCCPRVGDSGVYVWALMECRQKVSENDLSDADLSALGIGRADWDAAGSAVTLDPSDQAACVRGGEEGGSGRRLRLSEDRPTVAKLLRAQAYTRTRAYFEIACGNADEDEVCDIEIALDLDRCLVADVPTATLSVECVGAPAEEALADATIDFGGLEEGGRVSVRLEGVQPGAVALFRIEADMATYKVPDGVQLAKAVECLVANLKSDTAAESKQDPFWEECKRLALISLTAAAYEWYDPADRHLPTCMELLNMALPDEGGPEQMSPLGYLMRRWETGEEWMGEGSAAADPTSRLAAGSASGWAAAPGRVPHSRTTSLALNAYYGFTSGAPETVQSVIITCKTAFISLLSPEIRRMLMRDELALHTLGDPDRKQALFIVTKDTDSPFDFLTALLVYQAVDVLLDKAYKNGTGKLSRHVRFVLDEVMNVGKIPILIRALAVVRSRNISISMYMQSRAQAEAVYGEKEARILVDNCTCVRFLGGQDAAALKEFSETIGDETVYAQITNRSFSAGGIGPSSVSEHIAGNARKVRSAAQLRQMENTKMLAFVSGMRVIEDEKYPTSRHPYWPYVYSGHPRPWSAPAPRVAERFDFPEYHARRLAREAADRARGDR